jgi:aldehyde dehydrogenase (NAD+)
VLLKTANLLRERKVEIATDLVAEMGKTIAEADGEVERSADFFEFFSSLGRAPFGELLPDRRATLTITRREPVGLVLAITPWNDPLLTPARKLAPALIAGNAVILKPASDTPLVALHLARALHDAGLPAGVLTTVTGRGAVVVPALLTCPDLRAVSFTGSTETGLALRAAISSRNIRLQHEMGGKNASVICADADLDRAVPTVAQAAFAQAGQRCTATSRLLVASEVHDEVVSRLTAYCESLRLGPGSESTADMGPLVNRSQQDAVLLAIEMAQQQGATLACGGGIPTVRALANGCYVRPTVLTGVRPDMTIWREEVFGPVLAVRSFDTLDEAIRATNDSAYGLAAAIFTRDLGTSTRFMAEADAGQIAVNLATSGWDVHLPFGGFRDSGSPFKEQGVDALRFFTKTKVVSILSELPA